MANFAEVDENNIVIRVLVTDNNLPKEGFDWLVSNLGGTWVQTSYNSSIRKRYAGVGFTYNSELDVFISPKPYESWLLVEETAQWDPPVPYPDDENNYRWDEPTLSWVEITGE